MNSKYWIAFSSIEEEILFKPILINSDTNEANIALSRA